MMDLYNSAATIYDKVLAISALGNAGIENAVPEIEQIIKDQTESCLVRCKAIDALRRLRTQMPRKIQQILLPIFQNAQQRSEVRASALLVLLTTQPDSAMIDQIVFTISKEGNRQIQSFAYQQMKTLAKSKNPLDQQM